MTAPLACRLVAYQAGTDDKLGLLPRPLSLEASFTHNATGALTLRYSRATDGGDLVARRLEAGMDIAVEVNWGDGWREPYDGRFLAISRQSNELDQARVVEMRCPSYIWLLTKVRNLNTSAVMGKTSKYAGQRKMANADAGDIVKKFLDEHQARNGAGIPIDRGSWTASADSAGKAWAKRKTIYYQVGQDLYSVLEGLADIDHCDWRMDRRRLMMWNSDGDCVDVSARVRLRLGVDVDDAPADESMEAMVGRVLVRGEKVKTTVTSAKTPSPWGIWEGFIDEGGISTTAEAKDAANKEIEAASRVRGQYTQQLTMAGGWLPFRDYRPGDWVTGTGTAATGPERMRVQQVTIRLDGERLTGSVVLNDKITDAELKRASKLASLSGGSQSVSGSGAPGSDDDGPDLREPSAPTGLRLSDQLYVDPFGRHQAKLSATCDPVATATDGTVLDVAGYELWGQPVTDGSGSPMRRITASTQPAIAWQPFEPGSAWLFAMRAIGDTTVTPGVLCAPVGIQFGVDETPPPPPSPPMLDTSLGAVSVAWDGRDQDGQPMPPDWAATEIHTCAEAGFVPSPDTLTASIGNRAGGSATVAAPVGVPLFVRLVAVDITGNRSGGSLEATVVPRALVGGDLSEDVSARIDGAWSRAAAAQADAAAADARAVGAARTADAAQSVAASASSAASAAASQAASAAGIASGKADVLIQPGEPDPAMRKATTLWIDTTGGANTPKRWSGSAWVAVTDKTATDAAAAASAAQTTASAARTDASAARTAADAAAAKATSAQTSADGKSTVVYAPTAPGGAHQIGDTWFDTANGNRVARWDGSAWALVPLGTAALANLAVTNAQIADATIQSAKISALDAAKITTGTLAADRIATKSLSADQVMIGGGQNMFPDPYLLAGDTYTGSAAVQTGGGYTGGNAVKIESGTTQRGAYASAACNMPATPGLTYWVSGWVKPAADAAAHTISLCLGQRMRDGDANVATAAVENTEAIAAGAWTRISGQITTPTGTTWDALTLGCYAEAEYTGELLFSDLCVRQATSGELIVDGAVTAAKVAAGAIEAGKIAANAVTADKLAATIVLGSTIVAGSQTGNRVELDGQGLAGWRYNPDADAAVKVFSISTSAADFLALADAAGTVQAGIDQEGNATFNSVSTDALEVGGQTLADHLDRMPKGIVAWAQSATASAQTKTEIAYMEVRAVLQPGRLYSIGVPSMIINAAGATNVYPRILWRTDGTTPPVTNTDGGPDELVTTILASTANATPIPGPQTIIDTGAWVGPKEARFVVGLRSSAQNAWIAATAARPCVFVIRDEGPSAAQSSAILRRVAVWKATGSQANSGSNTARADAAYNNFDQRPLVVGQCGATGSNWSQLVFDEVAESGAGDTLAAAMAAASVEKAELWLHSQAGTATVDVRANTLTALDQTAPSGTSVAAKIAEHVSKWIDITRVFTAASRGVWLSASQHAHLWSALRTDPASHPRLRITYRK